MLIFWRRGFFNDCLTTLMLKVPPNMLPENIEFKATMNNSESRGIHIIIVGVFTFHRSELNCSSQN